MTIFKYQYTEDHLKYMKYQIHEMKERPEVYDNLSEFEFNQIKKFIGNPKVVFEAGSGLGRGSIYLNHLLKDDSVEYILADRDGYTNDSGAYYENVDHYYNDLSLTGSFCRLNGIKNFRTFETEKHNWATLPKVDLVFSLCSFGMHVPIAKYIDRLISISKPTTTMIFGTRHANYNQDSFKDRFEQVIYQPSERILVPELIDGAETGNKILLYPEENWLILKNPR